VLVSQYLTAVRRQGKVSPEISDADLLGMADVEIASSLMPLVRSVRQEFFVRETTVASFGGRCALPNRAIDGTVRAVQLLLNGSALPLARVDVEDDWLGTNSGTPVAWYFDGGSVVLLPRGSSGTVRLRYFARPGKLVSESDTTNVRTVIAAGTTLNSDGSAVLGLSGAIPTGNVDVVSSGPAHEHLLIDYPGAGGSSLTVPAANALGPFRIGDYVVTADMSPVVPLPEEMAAVLVHQVAAIYLRAQGYDVEANNQAAVASSAKGAAEALLKPRSEGNPRRLRGGIRGQLRAGRGWWW
jgi:hypothetical protein